MSGIGKPNVILGTYNANDMLLWLVHALLTEGAVTCAQSVHRFVRFPNTCTQGVTLHVQVLQSSFRKATATGIGIDNLNLHRL